MLPANQQLIPSNITGWLAKAFRAQPRLRSSPAWPAVTCHHDLSTFPMFLTTCSVHGPRIKIVSSTDKHTCERLGSLADSRVTGEHPITELHRLACQRRRRYGTATTTALAAIHGGSSQCRGT